MLRQLPRLFVSLILSLPLALGAQSLEAPKDPGTIPRIEVPRIVRISGMLSDLAAATTPTLETVTFTLYRDPEGLEPLWSETQNLEIAPQGRYQALLGVETEGGLPLSYFSATDARWLGVRRSGYPEQPPVMLLSVPYALKAADAETLGGKPPSAYMTVDSAAPPPSDSPTGDPESNRQLKVNVPIVGDGYKGYLAKFMNNNTIVTSRIFENVSGIGVNNSTPRSALDVSGEIFADKLTLSDSGTPTLWTLDQDLDTTFNPPKGRFRLFWRPDSASSYGILTVREGAIAIDHDNPRTALDINGQLAVNGAIKLAQDLGTSTPIWGLDNVTGPSRFRLYYQPTINTFGWILMSATSNRIGMFTEAPRTALDVWGEVTATNRLTLAQNTGTTDPTWHLENTGSLFRIFNQPNFTTAGTTVLVATRSGRVGIGVYEPTRTLDVAGTIGINGTGNGIVFPDGTVQTTAAVAGPLYSVCVSNAPTAPTCGCTTVVSQTQVSRGGTCTTSAMAGACTATSTNGGTFTYGLCCVCR